MDLVVDQVVGRYRIGPKIGQGGFGKVYHATDVEFPANKLALKVLSSAQLEEESEEVQAMARARFEAEAQAASRVDHPNVVKVRDFGRISPDGPPYLVMDFFQGESLHKALRRAGGRFSLVTNARIFEQLCQGLAAVHEEGIVHRDLKPDNIHLFRPSRDDDEFYVRILDFGIAKQLDLGTNRTIGGSGTPLYMAPEQWGRGKITPHADIYAVGVLLFQCFTGQLPFTGDFLELCTKHAVDPPPSPREFGISNDKLERLILDCLHKDPTQRPPHVRAVRDRLRDAVAELMAEAHARGDAGEVVDGGVGPAPRDGAGAAEVLTPAAAPSWGGALAVASGAGVRAGASGAFVPEGSSRAVAREAPAAADDAPALSPSLLAVVQPGRGKLVGAAVVVLLLVAGLGVWRLQRSSGAVASSGPAVAAAPPVTGAPVVPRPAPRDQAAAAATAPVAAPEPSRQESGAGPGVATPPSPSPAPKPPNRSGKPSTKLSLDPPVNPRTEKPATPGKKMKQFFPFDAK